MSHQTGIHASDELKVIFANCKAKRELRCIKLSIDKEVLICDESKPISINTSNLDWKSDWKIYMVEGFLPKNRPCYVLFRLTNGNEDQDIGVVPTTSTAPSSQSVPPVPAVRTSKASSLVSKLGPPKLASILTNSLSGGIGNSSINNNNVSSNTKAHNDINQAHDKSHDIKFADAAKDQWLFVSWTPESSPVREKMIYASTKSTVKQEFGGGSIFADYFVSSREDLSVESVRKWIERKQHIRDGHIDMNELSLSEQELQQVKADEAKLCADLLASAVSMKDCKNKSLPNIEMPIDDQAIKALFDFKQGKAAYVQMSVDPKSETILLEKSVPVNGFDLSKKSISSLTPKDHARYHLVSFSHQHDKKPVKSNIFIYSIPSSGCPVKERMLYSSVKNSLLQVIQDESKIGITVARRIETDDPSELTEKYFYEELYPVDISPSTPKAFVKPKGPSKQIIAAGRKLPM